SMRAVAEGAAQVVGPALELVAVVDARAAAAEQPEVGRLAVAAQVAVREATRAGETRAGETRAAATQVAVRGATRAATPAAAVAATRVATQAAAVAVSAALCRDSPTLTIPTINRAC